jgi:hypothetical protein
MMSGMSEADEFAEIDTSEAELDNMMATGQAVVVVTSAFLRRPSGARPWSTVNAVSCTAGATTVTRSFASGGAIAQTFSGTVGQVERTAAT